MGAVLKIVDEHFGGNAPERRRCGELRLASHRITPREIIRQRVEAEVDHVNRRKQAQSDGLANTRSYLIDTASNSSEAVLNGRLAQRRPVKIFDAQFETDRATTAFAKRGFIMLVDDRQVEDLDEAIALRPESEVVFLYLTPLKGG
jgi:hypothetical protein